MIIQYTEEIDGYKMYLRSPDGEPLGNDYIFQMYQNMKSYIYYFSYKDRDDTMRYPTIFLNDETGDVFYMIDKKMLRTFNRYKE